MEVLLIRHARPFHLTDPAGADPGLTPDGEGQAKRLAQALAECRYGRIDRLVSSPMRRARETAASIDEALSLGVVVDDRLAELDHGWSSYGLDIDSYADRRLLWEDMNAGKLGANVFDVADFRSRVRAGIDEVLQVVGGATAVVCHGGVINVVLADIVGARRTFFTEPDYTSVTRVHVFADGDREVVSVNEIDHLRG
jgi:broad specificity phosphatase PhoE